MNPWLAFGSSIASLTVGYLGLRFAYPALRRGIVNRDQSGTIKRLDDTLTAEIHARDAMERRHAQEVAELRADHAHCREELAELRGRMEILTGNFAKEIVAAIEKEKR